MKKLIKDSEIVGKTIVKILCENDIYCIHFTDDTCIGFKPHYGYEDSIYVKEVTEDDLSNYDLLDLQIITKAEYEIRELKRLSKEKEHLRKEFERLKLIFDD